MSYEDESGNQAADQQRRMRKSLMDQLKAAQIEEQKKEMLKKITEPAAYDRLMNIKISNSELYYQLIDLIISLAQSGKLQSRMSEAQLLSILQRATSRREPTVEFKHK